MSKAIGRILVLIVAGMLMIYSASRTYDLLSRTMPPGQEIVALIALAAFDIGLIAWLIIFLRGAEGGIQRGIALFMIVIDLCGVIVGFLGDTLYSSGETGLLAAMSINDRQTIIMLTAAVIAINIAGAVFFHMADPENLKRMATESARDQIEKQSLEAIKQQASLLAAELAPTIASDWVVQMRAQFTGSLTDHTRALPAPIVVDQPQSATPETKKAEKPGPIDKIKAALNDNQSAPPPQPQTVRAQFSNNAPAQTMAANGTVGSPEWSQGIKDAIAANTAQRQATEAAISARPEVAAAKAKWDSALANKAAVQESTDRAFTRLVDGNWGLTPEGAPENRTPEWQAAFDQQVTQPRAAAGDAEYRARMAYMQAYNEANQAPKAS